MKRLLTERLEKWKNHPRRKSLLLLGARQVGKTWLMQNFGENHYKQVAYVRFERNERLRLLFEESNSVVIITRRRKKECWKQQRRAGWPIAGGR